MSALVALLDAFAATDGVRGLSLSGDPAADALEAWAGARGLQVERRTLTRRARGGTGAVAWTYLRVVLRDDLVTITASRDDDTVVPPSVEAA